METMTTMRRMAMTLMTSEMTNQAPWQAQPASAQLQGHRTKPLHLGFSGLSSLCRSRRRDLPPPHWRETQRADPWKTRDVDAIFWILVQTRVGSTKRVPDKLQGGQACREGKLFLCGGPFGGVEEHERLRRLCARGTLLHDTRAHKTRSSVSSH